MRRIALSCLTLLVCLIGSSSAACPSGWVDISGNCYGVIGSEQLDWDEAVAYCSDQGATLAKIYSADDFRKVYLYITGFELPGDFWLGASDTAFDGDFLWLDGTRVPRGSPYWALENGVINWSQEPQGDTRENCLALSSEKFYYYDDMSCRSSKNFICMQPSTAEM